MRKQNFLKIIITIFLIFSKFTVVFAAKDIPIEYVPKIKYENWDDFKKSVEKKIDLDIKNGRIEVWTGALALIAGIAGDSVAIDPLEKGVFTIFQSIGVASIGLGLYDSQIGDSNRNFYYLLEANHMNLTNEQKDIIIQDFNKINKFYEEKENTIKSYTFGIMSLTQFYNASKVKNESVKNTLYFIGIINALVSLSYQF